MYMANAKILRLVPNATYIPLTRVGGFVLGDTKNLRHLTQKIPTCGIFALGDATVPKANSSVSQWNIGLRLFLYSLQVRLERATVGSIHNGQ